MSSKAKYACKYCNKRLSTKEALYEHLKNWHRHLKTKVKKALLANYERK